MLMDDKLRKLMRLLGKLRLLLLALLLLLLLEQAIVVLELRI